MEWYLNNMNRLKQLKRILEKNPSNVFAHYGIAMEYKGSNEMEKSAGWFQKLLDLQPDYRAAFFQYGVTLIDLGRTEEAQYVLERGFTICKDAGDEHAAQEIQELLSAHFSNA